MSKTLWFQNNVHNFEPVDIPEQGLLAVNLTVRKGIKWAGLKVGDYVELRGTDQVGAEEPPIGCEVFARIYDIKIMAFSDLQLYPKMLKLEHDPDCRVFHGLHRVMKKVYDGFLHHELVTLVFYIPEAPK